MKTLFKFLKLGICYLIPWLLINGWAWVGSALMPFVGVNWFTKASVVWLAILWLPCTPEKLLIIPIALLLHNWWYPNDTFGKEKLTNILNNLKGKFNNDRKRKS